MVKDATAALQRAKRVGPGNYQFFSSEMNVEAFERLAFENSLRGALERKEFELYYQPQIDLSTLRVVGAEALLRWNHPERGLVYPAQFVPILEETGLIVPVGEWVIETACQQALAWRTAGLPDMRIAVNISAKQFQQPDLAEVVVGKVREAGLSPGQLELEITESLLMEDTKESSARLTEIKAGLGVRFAIDDFGTGYSSLAYLTRFPIDVLKIDRAFVGNIAEDSDASTIVSAIVGLAHNLRMQVIAEGVETYAQLDYLRRQGCDEAQGFYFSRPLPAAEFVRLLDADGRLTLVDEIRQ